jgi:hypothetical protein
LAWYTNITKALSGFNGRTRASPTDTIGSSSEDLSGSTGYLLSTERSYKLRGRQRFITYNELVTNTVIVAAGIRYFLSLVANVEWTFQPPKDENDEPMPGAQDAADFVKSVFDDMASPWSKVVRRAARFRFHGFSWQEWTAKQREDGRIGLLDIEPRPCSTIERWDTDRGNTVLGVTQRVAGLTEVYLPRSKALYLVDDVTDDSPEGVGLLRHLVRSAERLKAYEELEQLAFETDLRGIPIGRVPLKEMRDAHNKGEGAAGYMSLDQIKKARSAVDSFVKNKLANKFKGAVFDSETYEATTVDGNKSPSAVRKWDVELIKGDNGPYDAAAKAIDRVNREMAQLLGIEHLLLGGTGTGSLALIQGKLSSTFLIVSSTISEVAEAVNSDLIAPICALNGIAKELWPKALPAELDVNDVAAVAAALSSLATAGAPLTPGDEAVDVVRGRMGLPPAPPPPELDPEDQALVDRMRMGLPIQVDPNPDDPNAPSPKPGDSKTPKPGDAEANAKVTKMLKRLLGPGYRERT